MLGMLSMEVTDIRYVGIDQYVIYGIDCISFAFSLWMLAFVLCAVDACYGL